MKTVDNNNGRDGFAFNNLMQKSSIIRFVREGSDPFRYKEVSFNVEDVLGFTPSSILSDDFDWLQRVHPEDRSAVQSFYSTITPYNSKKIAYRFKHHNGNYLWLRDEIEKVVIDGRDLLIGFAVEVTDSKVINDHILERKYKLQNLALDNLNDMVVISRAPKDDPLDSSIVFVNKAFEEFTGYRADEVIDKRPTFLHGPETSDETLATINKKIRQRESLREEFINYKKDGTPYWVELDMAPFPTDDGRYEYWVGINRDITQRKRAEKKLEESEKRHRTFTDLSFDAIFEIHVDGTILRCNKRACELFGYNRNELLGMHVIDLMPEKYHSNQPESYAGVPTTGNEAWERFYKKKDGTVFPSEIHTEFYEMGGQKRLIAYVRDITDRKKYEQEIQRSLKEKEMLLAEVHHRVKNNLAIISGLLQMQVFNTDDKQLLSKLKESQSRIQSIAMVHEKLYRTDSFSEIAIDKYIKDLLDMIEGSMTDFEKNITVKTEMESVLLTVGQAIPCGLLLNELITNCFKHAFVDRDKGMIRICLLQRDDEIALVVEDNGKGLPSNFDIESESSLGMTIIHTLTSQLNGSLKVQNDGEVTRFTLTFEIEK